MASVELNNISKKYGDQVVVEPMTLKIKNGEFVSLLGPSGCGKTTTLRMTAGLTEPSGGSIFIGENEVYNENKKRSLPPEKRHIGMVFQSYAIWPHMTVFQNVSYPLKIRKIAKADLRERTEKALDLVNLSELGERYPHQLSGGQQQRVALARALVMQPSVLLLDEPLSNLDAKLRIEMRSEIRKLQQELKITVIYVTHDQAEAMEMSDRVVIMNQGKVAQIGTPADIQANPADAFVRDFLSHQH